MTIVIRVSALIIILAGHTTLMMRRLRKLVSVQIVCLLVSGMQARSQRPEWLKVFCCNDWILRAPLRGSPATLKHNLVPL